MARCGCSSNCACAVRGTSCVRVTGSGAPESAYLVSIILDPAPGNALTCGEDGLIVDLPDPAVWVEETDCISLNGNGTPVDPIRASPVLDPAPGNALTCGEDGLMASPVGVPLFDVVEALVDMDVQEGWLILADSSSADITLALPGLGIVPGGVIVVKKIVATNDVVIDGFSSESIDGSSSRTLSTQWSSVTLVNAGTMWVQIGSM